MEAKIFGLFQVLYHVRKQVHKLELPKRWTIYNVIHMSLLKQNTFKKRQIDYNITRLDFEISNSNENKVEAI